MPEPSQNNPRVAAVLIVFRSIRIRSPFRKAFRLQLILFPTLLQEFCYQPRPPRLMAGADARAVVAVKILVEQNQVSPMRVHLKFLIASVNGTAPILIPQENPGQATRKLCRNLPKCHHSAGISRALYLEVVAQVVMKLL